MPIFQLNELGEEERKQVIAEFYDAIDCIENRKEVRLVFRDLLSPNEIAMLSRRIQIAILLMKGFSYDEIAKALEAGKGTVKRVKQSIDYHGEGYELLLGRLKKLRKKQALKRPQNSVPADSLTFDWFKQRYPGYFGLFKLVDALISSESSEGTPSTTYKEGEIERNEDS